MCRGTGVPRKGLGRGADTQALVLGCPVVRAIAVFGQGSSAERAHVAVNLAIEATLLRQRTLLVDLDEQAAATGQVFDGLSSGDPNLETLLAGRGSIDDIARPLHLRLQTWLVLSRIVTLLVVVGAPDLAGQRRRDAADRLGPVMTSAGSHFDVVVLAASRLSEPLGKAALAISDCVLSVVKAGPVADQEARTFATQATALGVPERKLLHVLTGTEVNKHFGRLALEAMERAAEQANRDGRPFGRLLKTRISHDVALAGSNRSRLKRRRDWTNLAIEVLSG